MMLPQLTVEVVYALPGQAIVAKVNVENGASVSQAILQSGLMNRIPDLAIETLSVGIWSKQVSLDAPVCDGDRIEIYRPLHADPKETRRRRAEKKKRT